MQVPFFKLYSNYSRNGLGVAFQTRLDEFWQKLASKMLEYVQKPSDTMSCLIRNRIVIDDSYFGKIVS